jgi:flagellar biosynthesis protein FlhB
MIRSTFYQVQRACYTLFCVFYICTVCTYLARLASLRRGSIASTLNLNFEVLSPYPPIARMLPTSSRYRMFRRVLRVFLRPCMSIWRCDNVLEQLVSTD